MKLLFMAMAILLAPGLWAQSKLEGKVTTSENGEALPGVNIFIPELGRGAVSRPDGTFTISDLPAGHLKVQASFLGYKTVIQEVVVEKGSALSVNFNLQEAALQSEEVVISAGTYTTQHQQAVKVEVISLEELSNSHTATAMEKLEDVPGLSLVSKGPGIVKPVIRGMLNSNVLVLVDGIRLENFQFSENHPYLVDDAGMGSVEVIKGPASLYYGSDAIGGVINFLTLDQRQDEGIHADISTAYHTVSSGTKLSANIRGTGGNLRWKAFGSSSSHKDYLDGNGLRVPNSRFQQSSAGFNTMYSKNNLSTKLIYIFNQNKLGLAVGPAFSAVNTDERQPTNWYQDLNFHLLGSKTTYVSGAYTYSASLSYQHNHRNLFTDDEYTVDMKLNNFNWDLSARRHGNDHGEWLFGIQGNHKQNANQEAEERVVPDHNQHDLSAYVLTDRPLSSRLRSQFGLRLDYRTLDVPEQEAGGHDHGEEHTKSGETEEHQEIEALNRDYLNLSGSAGLVYDLGEEMVLRLSLSSAFRNPSVPELTQEGVHGARYEQGNRDLDPQQAYQADIGWHWHKNALTADANVFVNAINNYIYLSPTQDTLEDGDEIFRYLQSDAVLYGAEVSARLNVLNQLDLFFAATSLRGEQSDGTPLPFIPQDALKIGAEYDGRKAKGLKPSGGITAKQVFPQDNPGFGETPSKAYLLLNAYVNLSYLMDKQALHLGVDLRNALDEAYVDHLSTLKGTPYAQPGRNLVVSLRYSF